jgi:hypothetical protein
MNDHAPDDTAELWRLAALDSGAVTAAPFQ